LDAREAYDLLGLDHGASLEEVQTAFRELAQIMHPDKFGQNAKLGKRAEEQFKRISAARDFLVAYLTEHATPSSSPSHHERPEGQADAELDALRARLSAIERALGELYQYVTDTRRARDVGLAWLAGGSIATVIGMAASAEDGGGTYLVFWGAILWGAYRTLRASYALFRLHRAWDSVERERATVRDHVRRVEQVAYGQVRTLSPERLRPRYSSRLRAAVPVVLLALAVFSGFGYLGTAGPAASSAGGDYFSQIEPVVIEAEESAEALFSQLESIESGGLPSSQTLDDVGSELLDAADQLESVVPPDDQVELHQALIGKYRSYGKGAQEVAIAMSSGSEPAWNRAAAYFREGDGHADTIARILGETGR